MSKPLLERVTPENAVLMVIDVQEKLFPHLDHECEFLKSLLKMVRGAQIMGVPIIATEQYPKGLGKTVEPLRITLGEGTKYWEKTSFSCAANSALQKCMEEVQKEQIILVGIEAHICVLQTAKDLLRQGKQVIIVNDAITSRSIYDFSTAIAEMRDMGARITSTETLLFEILGDAQSPSFKAISQLVQT